MRVRHPYLAVAVGLIFVGAVAWSQGVPAVVHNFVGPVTITGTLTTSGASTASAYTATTTSGDGLTLSNAAVDIQWPAANATLRGNASGIQTAGSFTAAGEGQFGSDGIRSEGTGVFDINNHSASGTTGFTWDRSVDITSGNFGCWRDNGTTALTCLSWAGNVVLQSTDSTASAGAATINKPCGRSAVANGAASVVITNSTVAATSNIQVTPLSASVTGVSGCPGWYVSTVGAGSFTLTCPEGAVAADWSFMWCAFGAM